MADITTGVSRSYPPTQPCPIGLFRLQKQYTGNWCWAAVGASLVEHANNGRRPTQCSFAAATISSPPTGTGCNDGCRVYVNCGSGIRGAVGAPGHPTVPGTYDTRRCFAPDVLDALKRFGVSYKKATTTCMSVANVGAQLKKDWPVVIEQIDGSGLKHVIVVTGVVASTMNIVDPRGYCKSGVTPGINGSTKCMINPGPFIWNATYHHV